MRRITPASGADRDVQLEVAPAEQPGERVRLTLRIRNRGGELRALELPLSQVEARMLAHALLDAANPTRASSEDD